jgi:hypothetical protein
MPRILIIIAFLVCSFQVISQTKGRFAYTRLGSSYLATPVLNNAKPEGKEGRPIWEDVEYINDLFNIPLNEVLTKEKRDSLHLNSSFIIAFDLKGEVKYCRFLVSYKDSTLISENDLYNLFLRFKNIKVDMSRVNIVPDYNTEWKSADFGTIVGSFKSKESRDRFNKRSEEKMLKNN